MLRSVLYEGLCFTALFGLCVALPAKILADYFSWSRSSDIAIYLIGIILVSAAWLWWLRSRRHRP